MRVKKAGTEWRKEWVREKWREGERGERYRKEWMRRGLMVAKREDWRAP